jgi:hypothetical protein
LPSAELSPAQGLKEEVVTDLSLDTELAEISKTQLFYGALQEVTARRDQMSRSAISGR